MSGEELRASGVEELIARLHDEGIAAGEAEGARILADARRTAEALLAEAEAARDALLARAAEEAEAARRGGEAALRLAARDTLRQVRQELEGLLLTRLSAATGTAMTDPRLLADLVRMAAAGLSGAGALEVRVDLADDALAKLAEALRQEAFGGEVVLLHGSGDGLRIRRAEGRQALDYDRELLARHIFARLGPALRAVLDGEPVG